MIASVNKLAEDEPSPRRGKSRGKGRKRATIGRDGTAAEILTDLKRQAVFREVEHIEVNAAGATESADDPERLRLDDWLGEWCDFGYTKHVKTRKPLDPYRDRVEVHGELIQAPQRMKRVRLLEKNEKNRNFPVYELRPETTMNGYDWEPRPDVLINDWSETGIARAKKTCLRRANRSRERRQELGKNPVAPPRPSVLLRRPPDVMFFLHNPTGKLEGVWEEPWEHGIVDPSAAEKNRMHNRKSMEFMNNLRVEFFDQWILGARTIDPRDLKTSGVEPGAVEDDPASDLDTYAETLKASEIPTASFEPEKKAVWGVDTGVMHGPFNRNPAEKKQFKAEGTKRQYMPRRIMAALEYNEPGVIDGEFEVVNEEVLASDVLHPDFIRAKQEQLYLEEVRATAQAAREHRRKMIASQICDQISTANMDTEETSMVPHCAARFQFMFPQMYIDMDMDDPRTVDVAKKAVLELGVVYRTLKKQIMGLKVHQGGLAQWLAPDADINVDGLLDDNDLVLEVERISTMGRPEPILHNAAEYERYKKELIAENRRAFFQKSADLERNRETKAVRKANRNLRAHRAQQRRERRYELRRLMARSYKYLYVVRKIHQPQYGTLIERGYPIKPTPKQRIARAVDWLANALDTRDDWEKHEELRLNHDQREYELMVNLVTLAAMTKKISHEKPEPADTGPAVQMVEGDLFVAANTTVHRSVKENYERSLKAGKPKSKTNTYALRGKEKIPTGDYESRIGVLQKQYLLMCGSPDSKDGDARGSPDEESGRNIIPRQYKSPDTRKGIRGAAKRIKDRAQRSYRAA